MARIRSIKPEVRRSLTVAEWPREVRLAWVYLWGYLDDHGRGLDDVRLIVAECFPLDRDVTERKIDRWLQLMATTKSSDDDLPPLCRYEVNGRSYLHATKWTEHQRVSHPQPSRIPPCPIHESIRNGSGTRPAVAPESRGNGSGPRVRARIREQGKDQGAGNRDRFAPLARKGEPPF